MKKLLMFVSALLASAGMMHMAGQAPAFPGAEGHGRFTTGGRGGKVYHVTNLSDDKNKEGSLRWALGKSGAKTIVFDVSGYIDLMSELSIPSNTTIAGQTAPEGGITLRYNTVKVNGDNIIIRFIRMRRSQIKDVNDGADASWGRNHKSIIIDHCSLSWSIDEVASFYDNRDFTLQWSTICEGLANPGHTKGAHSYGGIWGGKNVSFHHNMIAHVQNRAPRFNGARYAWSGYDNTKYSSVVDAERVDFRNCLMYNWGNGSACYGGPGGGYINIVNNYYKAGPGTKNKTTVTQVTVATSKNADEKHPELYGLSSRYYINGNYVSAAGTPENYDWNGVKYDGGLYSKDGDRYIPDASHHFGDKVEYVELYGKDCVKLKLDEPIDFGTVTTHTPQDAHDKILDYCGASMHRDAVDARYMEEARTGTVTYYGDVAYTKDGKTYATSNTKGILDFINDPAGEENPKTASYPELVSTQRPADFDSDGDGIPDAWERANGLDPNNAADGTKKTLDSEKGWYTNLEVYLSSLVEDIMKNGNSDAIESVDEYYPAYKTADSAIDDVFVRSDIEKVEYFDLNGIRLSEPAEGISIRRVYYTNGKIVTDKVIKR
ncbi:MAG: thrombospondin type 3 repeat-containing protein [Muribaculum sp.]|nr:thrombospondin type 3 repeat-containing protein [Muribaculum sp.]